MVKRNAKPNETFQLAMIKANILLYNFSFGFPLSRAFQFGFRTLVCLRGREGQRKFVDVALMNNSKVESRNDRKLQFNSIKSARFVMRIP